MTSLNRHTNSISEMRRVEFVMPGCSHCHQTFLVPHLGDFDYGQFILYGDRGTAFGYLSALDCPVWAEIESRLSKIAGLRAFDTKESINRLQEVVAASADRIEGQRLGLMPTCPFCHSHALGYQGPTHPSTREIPVVTFKDLEALPDVARDQRLKECWNSASSK